MPIDRRALIGGAAGLATLAVTPQAAAQETTPWPPREHFKLWPKQPPNSPRRLPTPNNEMNGAPPRRELHLRGVAEPVVGVYRPELSTEFLRDIDPKGLSFAWMGATERGAPHYFRLQGADFVFEYDNVQDNGNHVHSVWRNKSEDFGMQLLGEHYRTSHARAE